MNDTATSAVPQAADAPSARRASSGPRRSQASAEAILDAAQALLAEAGYAGFSIEQVAKRAGAGKPTIYRWWNGRAALLLDVYARQKLVLAEDDTGMLEEDLASMIRSVCRLWRETPAGDIFRSIIAEAQSEPSALEALRTFLGERRHHVAAVFERARARGELEDGFDLDVTLDIISGFLWARLLVHRLDDDVAGFSAFARQIARSVTRR